MGGATFFPEGLTEPCKDQVTVAHPPFLLKVPHERLALICRDPEPR